MPSWQARVTALAVRLLLRRRRWGDERALARRARRLFGAPPLQQWLALRGLRREPVVAGGVPGEWLVPPGALPGAVLYVHGGGFVSCSAATHRPITAALARLTRRRVLAVDYRRAPEARFPAAIDDVTAAYEWLLGTGVPARSVAVAGDSAGGGLALSLAVRTRDRGLPAPACVVCFSPWADLAGAGESVRANDGRDVMFHTENIADFAAAYLGPASPHDPQASPVYAALHGLPPVLIHVAPTELLLDDARRVHERIQQAGGASRLEVYDGAFHAWQMLVPFVPEATHSLRDAAAFIAEHL